MRRNNANPKQIILSKRANVFYMDHIRVMQKDDRVVYLSARNDVGEYFNIPERNTMFLLLGKGSSITDSAIRKLAESNVVVGFVGNGGSPLLATVDHVFLSPQSEYRPTEYAQAWMRMWLDESQRLNVARHFFIARILFAAHLWQKQPDLVKRGIVIPDGMIEAFKSRIACADNTAKLMSVEAEWAKGLYRTVSSGFKIEFRREEGKGLNATVADTANSYLDHGNYIAYGFAASALNVLGIPYSLPIMHGKTRRGALVFDVADICKDAVVLPLAFACAKNGIRDQDFRDTLIDRCHEIQLMDTIINTILEGINLRSNISA